MDQILIADKDRHAAAIRDLIFEYLSWGASQIYQIV